MSYLYEILSCCIILLNIIDHTTACEVQLGSTYLRNRHKNDESIYNSGITRRCVFVRSLLECAFQCLKSRNCIGMYQKNSTTHVAKVIFT